MAAGQALLVGMLGMAVPVAAMGTPPGSSESAGPRGCHSVEGREHEPIDIGVGFDGSEDLTFDGSGGLIARRGSDIIRVDAEGVESVVGQLENTVFGLRAETTGSLVAARWDDGEVVRIDGADVTTILESDGPNGIDVAPDGTIWVTGFHDRTVTRIDPDGAVERIVEGDPADEPNGVVYDAERDIVFFTNYSAGEILRVTPSGTDSQLVSSIDGARLDGLALDSCGDLYVVDNANNRLYGIALDDIGDAESDPVLLAQFEGSVANAQFGAGDGWNADSLYVIGTVGRVFEVPVGISGQ